MVNDKDIAILIIIRDYILSERERQGLPAPVPSTELSTAARETAIWLASEEDFEDKISDYLRVRLVEQNGNANVILFPGLAYGRHIWPADAEASEIAKDLIERIGFSEVVNFPALDQLGISSGFAVLDQSGNPVETSGGQPHEFGYTLVVAYASDGNNMIVDQINERRGRAGAAPLEVSVPLREIARKSIATPIDDVTRASLLEEARSYGYASEGLRVRLDYSGSFAKFPSRDDIPVTEPQMAEIVASQLIRDWPTLLRPDWQDIGIATGVKNHPELGGLNFQAEFVIGWRIPFDEERPDHFPPAIDKDGNPSTPVDADAGRGGKKALDDLLGPVYREPDPKPQRRRGWWPFRS